MTQYRARKPWGYEDDHLVALSIGGHPTEPRNGEWGAERKDQLELVIYKMLCHNEVSLLAAQIAMSSDWVAAYTCLVPTHPKYRFKGRFAD